MDGWIQGAAYPLSLYNAEQGDTFLGPLACAVAPDGDLYVGCIRDSGWGGANNTGTLVRLRPSWNELPAGIAEVRATPNGFRVAFTRPVDADLASDFSNYAVSSYRRISTPEYGGPDVDRRIERVVGADVSEDRMAVVLTLTGLRGGFVYELRVKNLSVGGTRFFPAEAYYTPRKIPSVE